MALTKTLSGTSTTSSGASSTGSNGAAFLGSDSRVVGTLTFSGNARLDGFVEGEVHSKDQLEIGESAVINAKVSGNRIVVRGTVNGDIEAKDMLTICKPAKVTGNISSRQLSIEEGVQFEGSCSMSAQGPAKLDQTEQKDSSK